MTVSENNTRKYQFLTLLFVILILVGSIVGTVVPAGPGWDFANFYDTGGRLAAGQIQDLYNPHSLIGGEQPQGQLGFWGTPLSAMLYVPLAWFPPEAALILFKTQNTVAYFAAFLVLFIFNRKFVDNSPLEQWKFVALFTFLCLIYQPFWTIYRVGGQTTPTVVLFLALALVSHARLHFYLSSMFFTLAVVIKPAFTPALLFLMFTSGVGFFLSTVGLLSLVGIFSVAIMGWSIHLEFLTKMIQGIGATYPWFYNSSVYIVVEHIRLLSNQAIDPHFGNAVFTMGFVGIKAIVIGIFVIIMVKSRSEEWSHAARSHFDFLMAICFGLLISQTVWEHYLSVLFLPLVYITASHREFSMKAKVLVGTIVFLAMGQNLIFINYLRYQFSFQTVPQLLGICLFKSGPLLLTLFFLWRFQGELFNSYNSGAWAH